MPLPGKARQGRSARGDRYRWVALTNTTAAAFMSQVDRTIVIIAVPAIFRGFPELTAPDRRM